MKTTYIKPRLIVPLLFILGWLALVWGIFYTGITAHNLIVDAGYPEIAHRLMWCALCFIALIELCALTGRKRKIQALTDLLISVEKHIMKKVRKLDEEVIRVTLQATMDHMHRILHIKGTHKQSGTVMGEQRLNAHRSKGANWGDNID